MRENMGLYRGKRKDNGAWETGGLVVVRGGCSDEQVFISDKMTGYHTPVLPETVGQFTGVTDKNGRKIFEGDIIKSCEYGDIYAVKYFGYDNYPAFDCVPEVSNCECNGLSFLVNVEGCEVIGNIYDNPELIKVE